MREPVRIACCSGFYGDRPSAALEMVEGGNIDVLMGDWLAELTMLILHRTRQRRPDGGFARTFVSQMEQVIGLCLDRNIKVVSNAGGLDPAGCAEALASMAGRLGLAPVIAYVDGDDLTGRLDELIAAGALRPLSPQQEIDGPAGLVTANAYLGCWGIVDALSQGADVVITGRTTDAALTCGPAAWWHGWKPSDLDALAGAVVAGHVLECSAQATGGNYSFFTEMPSVGDGGAPVRLGFPWAEVAHDGSSVIGKHADAGGFVTIGTVTSQLLYEIGSPEYLGPDVTARFDTIELEQVGPDRVRISGTRGQPPPPTLKVGANMIGGYRNSFSIALTGLDIEAKARLARTVFWDALALAPNDFESVVETVHRTDKPDPATQAEATAVWQITVKDHDEAKVGRSFTDAMVQTSLASIPGMYPLWDGPPAAKEFGVHRAFTVPAELVPQHVHLLGSDATTIVERAVPVAAKFDVPTVPTPPEPHGPCRRVELGRVLGTRSGDKGGDANLGVFARNDVGWSWLDNILTVDRLRDLLPEIRPFVIERHRLANLRALNFVIFGLLEEGVAGSTRRDPQAKALGEWLRARVASIPISVLAADVVS